MNQLGAGDTYGNGGTETTTVTGLTIGATYFIRVWDYKTGYGTTNGDFTICVYSTPAPNLTIDVTASSSGSLIINGNSINLTADIINNGSSYLINSSTVAYYLSLDAQYDNSDYLLGTDLVGNLAPGEHSIQNITIDACSIIPSIPNATYYVIFYLDRYNDVSNETDETIDNIWHYTTLLINLNCTVGIGETNLDNTSISIIPNPTTGNIKLNIQNKIKLPATVSITNMLGETVMETQINSLAPQLNINAPAGIYFLKLQNQEVNLTKKIVIEE